MFHLVLLKVLWKCFVPWGYPYHGFRGFPFSKYSWNLNHPNKPWDLDFNDVCESNIGHAEGYGIYVMLYSVFYHFFPFWYSKGKYSSKLN